jgi:3-isopropylmalate/(R)-2-methylmalate dehydratase large subunit
MTIEGGARAGMVASDDTTYEYMAGRPLAPKGAAWDAAVARWRKLPSDTGARFDREVDIDVAKLRPMVTFGTNPGMVISIDEAVPNDSDPAFRKALAYMQVEAGKPMLGKPVDVVFIGSCTNGRLSDIREAARILRGRHVDKRVRLLVVPGSEDVKRQAEAEGLDEVVRAAGGEWREPGCSMCIGMNGDTVPSGKLSVSTSNRNFEGRQGSGARTVLASPLTAAAAAVKGAITDPRELVS